MARLLRMPSVAANAAEAVLADWSLAEGAEFAASDAIATVETEKAVVDIEPDGAGVLLKTLVGPGAQVAVGAPIALLGDPGEQVVDIAAALRELGVESGPTHPAGAGERVFASPLARRLAREAGLELGELSGTGPRNRVLRRDVERAVAERPASQPPVSERPVSAPSVAERPPVAESTGWTDVPHSRIRRATAARLTESKQSVPHFYLRATLRAERLLALREELREDAVPTPSITDLLLKAVAAAHVRVPDMNVAWTPDAVRRFDGVDVSLAVATDRGLLTPVVRGVDRLTLTELARTTRDLVDRARAGRLRQEELEGGSISVSNLGMLGTEEFAAIINPPQAAILAVGAVRDEPVVTDGHLDVGQVLRVTLSVDHRPVDGETAARWLHTFTDLLAHPARILA